MEEEGEVGTYRGVYKDCLVKVLVATRRGFEGGDGSHGGLFEHAQGVALSNELINVSATEGTLKKEHNILNHVFISDEIQESGERLNSLSSQVLEFSDELIRKQMNR